MDPNEEKALTQAITDIRKDMTEIKKDIESVTTKMKFELPMEIHYQESLRSFEYMQAVFKAEIQALHLEVAQARLTLQEIHAFLQKNNQENK